MSAYKEILKKYWGYDNFRPLQEDIIESVGAGHDTLGLMPTGGGKSITFQVPALAMDGLCIVITPLIALMKDQVDNLKAKGIKAAAIYSGMSKNEISLTLDNAILGGYKFLYVSPERLATDNFLIKIKQGNICMIAVDESHCISQWGYDFRPSYLQIAEFRDLFPNAPVLALTATATQEVIDDIQKQLRFRNGKFFRKSFARKNIAYIVRETDNKIGEMLNILDKVPGTSIVYVRNRKKTREIAEIIKQHGITADNYHAGLTPDIKDQKQENWKNNETRVIVATNAFGMGIDKPDVRTVIHIDLPDNLEAYFQEAGRAGRDEKKAYAVLLYNKSDSTKLKKRIPDNFPEKKFIKRVYEAVGNYFAIAEGCGLNATFDFEIDAFCKIFKFNILQTLNSLKILQQAGYIELAEDSSGASRFMVCVTKEDLYHINAISGQTSEVLQMVLRTYTGVFSEYAYIDENIIARKLNKTRDDVYKELSFMRKLGAIDYIPGKITPMLTFTRQRVDISQVAISKEIYENRKAKFEDKINSVINYASDTIHCRSRTLLKYFGEENSDKCGVCDICIENKKKRPAEKDIVETRKLLLDFISDKGYITIFEASEKLGVNEEAAKRCIRWMLDEGEISLDSKNRLVLNTD